MEYLVFGLIFTIILIPLAKECYTERNHLKHTKEVCEKIIKEKK